MKIVISSGHAKKVQGAVGVLNEVDEARRVVNQVAKNLDALGVTVVTFHDDVSTSQSENLDRIVDFHNAQGPHDFDVSVHFNAYEDTSKLMGPECLYLTQDDLAAKMATAIYKAGVWTNPPRGAKYRDNLAFLNGTAEPSILIETCFVDSTADADLYNKHFNAICDAIASTLVGSGAVA